VRWQELKEEEVIDPEEGTVSSPQEQINKDNYE